MSCEEKTLHKLWKLWLLTIPKPSAVRQLFGLPMFWVIFRWTFWLRNKTSPEIKPKTFLSDAACACRELALSTRELVGFIAKLQDGYLNKASILWTSSGVTLKRYGWSRFRVGNNVWPILVSPVWARRSQCVYIVCKLIKVSLQPTYQIIMILLKSPTHLRRFWD